MIGLAGQSLSTKACHYVGKQITVIQMDYHTLYYCKTKGGWEDVDEN